MIKKFILNKANRLIGLDILANEKLYKNNKRFTSKLKKRRHLIRLKYIALIIFSIVVKVLIKRVGMLNTLAYAVDLTTIIYGILLALFGIQMESLYKRYRRQNHLANFYKMEIVVDNLALVSNCSIFSGLVLMVIAFV